MLKCIKLFLGDKNCLYFYEWCDKCLYLLILFFLFFMKKKIRNLGGLSKILIRVVFFSIKILWISNNLVDKSVNQQIKCAIMAGDACINENIEQGLSYNQTNVDIGECFFRRFSLFSGDGGVISISGQSYSLKVVYCMFYNCTSSKKGGAIYFSSYQSILHMNCAKSCTSTNGHFSFLKTKNDNHVLYLSCSTCALSTTGYFPIVLINGNQTLEKSNISNCQSIETSGFCSSSPTSFTSIYCTFSNNNSSVHSCVFFSNTNGTMSFTNIIKNNSPEKMGVVLVDSGGFPKMHYCIFNGNFDALFCVWSGSLEVFHCFLSHSGILSKSVPLSMSNSTFLLVPTYQIQFFKSYYCNADLSLPNRTPKATPVESPLSTIMKTIGPSPQHTPARTFDIKCDIMITKLSDRITDEYLLYPVFLSILGLIHND